MSDDWQTVLLLMLFLYACSQPHPTANHPIMWMLLVVYFHAPSDEWKTILVIGLAIYSASDAASDTPDKPAVLPMDKVIGLESVKKELALYFDVIQHPSKYAHVHLPRGILLTGPPGTGKTLLVREMAKHCKIKLHSASGSEFMDTYVGVGAARVRKLFRKARQEEQSIVFIDEIDAIGTKRDVLHNSERANTLNQLLVEMDGIDESNLFVFAATNMARHLDPALVRCGRFDKKIHFDLPNHDERQQLYQLYLPDMPLPEQVIASRSAGLSGADIASIANQAKLNTLERDGSTLSSTDLQDALDEVMIGRIKRERTLSRIELERVAYHEAGHAVLAFWMKDAQSPLKVSIIPRGESALGFSQSIPHDLRLFTQHQIVAQIVVLMGGRAAEQVIYNNVSTGAADDIEKIKQLIHNYFTRWAMHGIHFASQKNIDQLCTHAAQQLATFAEEVLNLHKPDLQRVARPLLTNESLSHGDLEQLVAPAGRFDAPRLSQGTNPTSIPLTSSRSPGSSLDATSDSGIHPTGGKPGSGGKFGSGGATSSNTASSGPLAASTRVDQMNNIMTNNHFIVRPRR